MADKQQQKKKFIEMRIYIEKNKMRGFVILDNNTCYKTTVIKTVWHQHREIMIKI